MGNPELLGHVPDSAGKPIESSVDDRVKEGGAIPLVITPTEMDIRNTYDGLVDEYFESRTGTNLDVYDVLVYPALEGMLRSENGVFGVGGRRVIDLACATGGTTRKLLDWGADKVLGVDISPGMIKKAKETVGVEYPSDKVSFVEMSMTNMEKIPSSWFHVGTCVQGIDYTDVPKSLSEMSRIIVPNGRLTIVVSHPDRHRKYWEAGGNKGRYPSGVWVLEAWSGAKHGVPKQYFHMSDWLNMFAESPWELHYVEEPMPGERERRFAPEVYSRYESGPRLVIFDLINKK